MEQEAFFGSYPMEADDIMFNDISLDDLDMQTPKIPTSPVCLWMSNAPPTRALMSPINTCSPFSRPLVLLSMSPHQEQVAPSGSKVSIEEPDMWQKNKDKIRNLYMTENMNLKDVINIMAEEHGFKATQRMYKRRIQQWGWHKYNSKRRQQDLAAGKLGSPRTGKTCRRSAKKQTCVTLSPMQYRRVLNYIQPRQVKSLIHANETAQILNMALAWACQYLNGCAESDPEWAATDETDCVFYGMDSWDDILAGMRHFNAGDYARGGRLFRRACKVLEEEMVDYPLSIIDQCLWRMNGFLDPTTSSFGQRILNFMLGIVQLHTTLQFLAPILRCFVQILQQQRREAESIHMQLVRLWFNKFRELRGVNDLTTLTVTSDYMRVYPSSQEQEQREAGAAYDRLLDLAISKQGENSDMTRSIEEDILEFHYINRTFPDWFVARNEALLRRILDEMRRLDLLTHSPSRFNSITLCNCYWRLFYYYSKENNLDKVVEIAKDYMVQAQRSVLEVDRIEYLYFMECDLYEMGLEEEAQLLQAERLQCKLYQDLEREFADEETEFLVNKGTMN